MRALDAGVPLRVVGEARGGDLVLGESRVGLEALAAAHGGALERLLG